MTVLRSFELDAAVTYCRSDIKVILLCGMVLQAAILAYTDQGACKWLHPMLGRVYLCYITAKGQTGRAQVHDTTHFWRKHSIIRIA